MSSPVVAVYDPSRYPFSLAAVIGCADRDHAATVALELRAEYPAGIVTIVYPGQSDHPAGRGRS